MKKATYTLLDGSKLIVDYDEAAPCRMCGLPVIEASVGGTDVCPWCDVGVYRDGIDISFMDMYAGRVKAKAALHSAPKLGLVLPEGAIG